MGFLLTFSVDQTMNTFKQSACQIFVDMIFTAFSVF